MDKKPAETSPTPDSTSKFNFLIALLCGLLILAHFISSFFPKSRLWGINHLAYFPLWVRLVFTLPGLLILVPWVNSRVYKFLDRILAFFQKILPKREVLTASLLAVISMFFFWLLRTRTYFLGDGYAYITQLGSQVYQRIVFEVLECLTHLYLYKFLKFFFTPSPEFVYVSLSIVAGGVFVFVLFFLTKALSENRFDRLFIFSIFLFSGATQLFLGYVEHYTLTYVSILAYLYFSLRYLQGKSKIRLPILFCALSIGLYFASASLLPSLFFLFALKRKKGELVFSMRRALPYLFILIFLFALAIFYVWSMNPAILDIFVPLFKGASEAPNYTLFSPEHLLDMINQHLLLSAIGVILILGVAAVYKKKITFKNSIILFLIIAFVGQFSYHFLIDPKFGAVRDWDMFSHVGLAYTLLGAYLFVNIVQSKRYSAIVLIFTAFLSTLPWFLVNANTERAIGRFKYLVNLDLKRSMKSRNTLLIYLEQHFRLAEANELNAQLDKAFPEQVLTLEARNQIELGNYDKARELLSKALAINPDLMFAHHELGALYLALGQADEAIEEFQKVIRSNPYIANPHVSLARAFTMKGKLAEALEELKKGVKFGGASADVLNNLGYTYWQLGQPEKAKEELKESIKMDPKFYQAHFGLGQVYLENNYFDQALTEFQEVERLRPDFDPVYYNLGLVYAYKGMKEKAIEEFELFLKLSKDETQNQTVRGLIQQLRTQKQ